MPAFYGKYKRSNVIANVIGYNKQRAFCIKSTLVEAYKVARRKNVKFKGKSLFPKPF